MDEPTTPADMTAWLLAWCARHGLRLDVDGECGFGRECVGVSNGEQGLRSAWVAYDTHSPVEQGYRPIPGQEALAPGGEAPDAYHKDDLLCVLGRGDYALAQLYRWVRRLDAGGATVERDVPKPIPDLASLLGVTTYTRIVLPESTEAN